MHPREVERWLNPDWRAKLEAWWEGYDLASMHYQAKLLRAMQRDARPRLRHAVPAARGEMPAVAAPADCTDTSRLPDVHGEDAEARALEGLDIDRRGQPVWSVEQVRGAQMLWGDDFVGPGNAAFMMDAVRSFGLDPAKSVLDCSAGLGGAARAIASTYGTWVTGLEPSPLLAGMGMRRSQALNLDRKAPVMSYDPEAFSPAGNYDLVLADRVLHRVRDKEPYLDNLCRCVKPKGSVLLMDYVIEGAPGSWDNWNAWKDSEPLDLYPWTAERMKDELVRRNMDVRIVEDMTAVLRRLIVDRVHRLAEALQSAVVDKGLLAGLARELQLWWARLKVLGQGLHYYRFVAMKPA
ncbi:MAG TPA: methyltransferase domain-containing protein [Azospirillum sp.]|nr:methyltransferase domain-containing protein [Azospirillum sp.]